MNTAGKHSFLGVPLLFLLVLPAFAQKGPPPIDKSRNPDRIRQQDQSQREWQLRNFGTESNAPKDRRQIEALMAQTEEDFTRILTLHNEFAHLISGSKPIDYSFVTDATAEIKKRASRLQSTLALRQLPDETPVVEKSEALNDDAQMKDALIKLCKQIRSFVTNPVIENPSTVDAQQLSNARRDLESVIQLSGNIKKEATKHK